MTVHWYPLFLVGCWCAGLIPYMFFDLIEVMFLVWSCSSENFVVVSAGWDIRVGCRAWGALVCLVLCVLVFCFVSSSLFF